MQLERRKNGERYVLEAHGPDRPPLEALGRQWPGSYVEWETMGIPLRGPDGRRRLSGPTFVLWRPLVAPVPSAAPDPFFIAPDLSKELEDPAEFLGLTPASPMRAHTAPPPPAREAPPPPPARTGPPPAPTPPPPIAEASPPPGPEPLAPAVEAPRPPARRHQRQQSRLYKSVKHKNLTRVDRPSKNLHGYHVRLGWKGQVYQKWFSDTTHGDRLGALTAALAWRDAKERAIGKPRSEQTVMGITSSNTGLVGIARVTVRGAPYYRALWRDAEDKMHRRWFSITRLGERRALRAAIKAREQGVAERQR